MRREDLAALAGVSIDYLTRLEQGKETNPGTGVLDALAGALLLDSDADAHLYTLANEAAHRTPPRGADTDSSSGTAVRPAVEQLIERLRPSPVYVLDQISNIRAANPEAAALFVGINDWPRARRNTIRYLFLHPAAHDLFLNWQDVATDALAHLRSRLANPAADSTAASALIEELSSSSQEFQRLWNRYDVHPRRSRPKNFQHPTIGKLTLHQEILYLSDDGLRMNIYQAKPGTADENALTLLSLNIRDQLEPAADGQGQRLDHPPLPPSCGYRPPAATRLGGYAVWSSKTTRATTSADNGPDRIPQAHTLPPQRIQRVPTMTRDLLHVTRAARG